jgi:hypothetical protein
MYKLVKIIVEKYYMNVYDIISRPIEFVEIDGGGEKWLDSNVGI